MRTPQNILEGFGFAANSALGLGRGLKAEVKTFIAEKIEQKFQKMDFVRRHEYEELRLMVEKLRAQQEENDKTGQ